MRQTMHRTVVTVYRLVLCLTATLHTVVGSGAALHCGMAVFLFNLSLVVKRY